MQEQELIKRVIEMRKKQGITQKELANLAGVTNVYISNLEQGKKKMSVKLHEKLEEILLVYDSGYTPEILFDYCRIRFPTQDIRYVLEDILHIRAGHMLHEEHGFYGYSDQYILGDISVMTSLDSKKGILLELKGRGCRQFERYLAAQGRDWMIKIIGIIKSTD